MPPTDKNPTDNDRKPKTNEEIVSYLQNAGMHSCNVLKRRVGKTIAFECRTEFQGAEYHFEGMWLDGTGTKVLAGSINKEHARAKAIASLIDDNCFHSVEAWVVACRNALGDNIDSFELTGAIFVDGQCVDDLLDALLDAPPSPAEDKTDGKQPASPADDKTDGKEPASPADDKELELTDEQLENVKASMKYIHFFCEQHAVNQPMQTVS